MRHKVLTTSDNHPYEIIRIELIGENKDEENSIRNVDEAVQDYLLLSLNTVEVIENLTPIFLIKRTKQKLGLG